MGELYNLGATALTKIRKDWSEGNGIVDIARKGGAKQVITTGIAASQFAKTLGFQKMLRQSLK